MDCLIHSGQGSRRSPRRWVWPLLLALGFVWAGPLQALPETKRVNSVKSLTHILSLVEKNNGDEARFFTMKLQIYLEDVYISQGTAIVLRPADLSRAVGELVADRVGRSAAGKIILRRYQDGEFHEK